MPDSAAELLDHRVLVVHRRREVDRCPGPVGYVAGIEQCLGRNASFVETDAAEIALLDKVNRSALLSGPQSSDVAGRTAAQHNDIVRVHQRIMRERSMRYKR